MQQLNSSKEFPQTNVWTRLTLSLWIPFIPMTEDMDTRGPTVLLTSLSMVERHHNPDVMDPSVNK